MKSEKNVNIIVIPCEKNLKVIMKFEKLLIKSEFKKNIF